MLHITRRNLPHWKREGAIYWMTFRMADSLPAGKLKRWKLESEEWKQSHPEPWDDFTWKEYDRLFGDRLEEWLDAGHGSCALARPEIRTIVQQALLRFNGERLTIHGAVIMPNHVHLLLELHSGEDLSKIMKGIKGASARQANKLLGTTGIFWMEESYDHIVRSEAQYDRLQCYIAENPIKAHLNRHQFWLYTPQGNTDIPATQG